MHQSSLENMARFRETWLAHREKDPLVILDLGSMDVNGSYREMFDRPPWIYTGLDVVPGKNVDIVLKNTYHWREIDSGSVDVLISGQAFEHIAFFWITMLEIARILKPGGICCIIAPSSGPEHRYPVDCWRFFPDGMDALARFARLKVLAIDNGGAGAAPADAKKEMWKDTVLVCRKYRLSFFYALRQRFWQKIMHWVLTRRLPVKSTFGDDA
jgi:SAM-dependent methyltransferase